MRPNDKLVNDITIIIIDNKSILKQIVILLYRTRIQ